MLYLLASLKLQEAWAADGTQFRVGMLLDESFEYFSGKYWAQDPYDYSKISGWETYTEGGSYSNTFYKDFTITDNGSAGHVVLKHRFVSQSSGVITLYYRFKVLDKTMDGISWSLDSGPTEGVKVLTSQGNLCFETSDGKPVVLQAYKPDTEYGVKVVADITKQFVDIYVDGAEEATGVTFRNKVHDLNYVKIATTATGSFQLKPVRIYKGYDVFEDFESTMTNVPSDWSGKGSVSVEKLESEAPPDVYSMKLDDTSTTSPTSVSKSFAKESNKVVFTFEVMLPLKMDGASAELTGGPTTAVTIIADKNDLCYVNPSGTATPIWTHYLANVWYNLKIVADPLTQKCDIYVNGKPRAVQVLFYAKVSSFDKIAFFTSLAGTGTMWLDDISVSPFQALPADYVPPPTPVASTNYIVGMQTFPGWMEGRHVGWDWPYRFPLHNLAMGTYDEESPEASDWQMKFMAEHGINFFLECWYGIFRIPPDENEPLQFSAPLKLPMFGYNIHKAYFNNQYSNCVKFAISDYNGNYTSSYFRKVIVPFWMEYYFRDPRYMTIDNKPVIAISNYDGFKAALGGSTPAVKAELDYLRNQLVASGFSGAYILSRYEGSDKKTMDDLHDAGIDYAYAYTFGGGDIGTMEERMTSAQKANSQLGVLPTASVGWSNEAWDGQTGSYVSVANFQHLCDWIKGTYMSSGTAGTLEQNTVLIDNWNEYGEGHWINPGTLGGFGYLDAIRNTYVGDGSHIDIVPTEAQKLRLNRHFPKGWIGHSWNFDSSYSDTEGWSSFEINKLATANGFMTGTYSNNDPQLVSRDGLNINLDKNKYVKIRYKNSSVGTRATIYFSTATKPDMDEATSKSFAITPNDSSYTEYIIDMSTVPDWSGTLKQLRVDPVNDGTSSGSFSIDYIQVTDEGTRGN